MKRCGCLLLVGLLSSSACTPAVVPAREPSYGPAQRLTLADAVPAPPAPADSASSQQPASAGASDAATPLQAPASSDPSRERYTYADRDQRQLARAWGWALGSIGAGAGLLAIGTSILMLEDNSTRNSNCNAQKVCNTSGLTANTQLADLGGWNMAFWIIGAAGLGAGAYLLLTNPSDEVKSTQVGVVSNGSGANLQLRGSF